MILTFVPPLETATKLAVPGGLPVEDLHITLLHFENATFEDEVYINEVARRYAEESGVCPARILNYGRFENVKKMQDSKGDIVDATEPTDVIYGSLDTLYITEERERLKELCDEYGLKYSNTFSNFVPHITIGYVPHGGDFPDKHPAPISFIISDIQVWPKKGQRITHNLL